MKKELNESIPGSGVSIGQTWIGKGQKPFKILNIHYNAYNDTVEVKYGEEGKSTHTESMEEFLRDVSSGDLKIVEENKESSEVKEKVQEDQYENERRRGVPAAKRIAEQEYYDNEEWYKQHAKDYNDITDFVEKEIAGIAEEYNLRDTKAEEVCKEIYKLMVNFKTESATKNIKTESKFNLEDAAADVYSKAEEYYKGSEINSATLTYVMKKDFYYSARQEKLLTQYFEQQEALYEEKDCAVEESKTADEWVELEEVKQCVQEEDSFNYEIKEL